MLSMTLVVDWYVHSNMRLVNGMIEGLPTPKSNSRNSMKSSCTHFIL